MTDPVGPSTPPDGSTDGTNRKAVWSVACGILAFGALYLAPVVGLVLSLPSITSGIHARREVKASHGRQDGDSLAVIGITIGAGALVTFFASLLLDTLTQR